MYSFWRPQTLTFNHFLYTQIWHHNPIKSHFLFSLFILTYWKLSSVKCPDTTAEHGCTSENNVCEILVNRNSREKCAEISIPMFCSSVQLKVHKPYILSLFNKLFNSCPPPPYATTKMEWQIQRRKIQTEEKAKVVSAVWGTELIQFLATLAILYQDDLKKDMNLSYSLYRPGAIHPIIHIIILVQFILFFNCFGAK